jgi:hypothetical protein
MKNKKLVKIIIYAVILIIVFLAGLFLGKAIPNTSPANNKGFSSSTRGTVGARLSSGGFASGKIESKDSQSITLQLPNGNSEVVFYSSSTQVIKPSQASLNDISVGTQVMIGGTQNSDGSLTAQSIQIVSQGSSTEPRLLHSGQ